MFELDTNKTNCPIRITYGPQTLTEDGSALLVSPIHESSLRDSPDRPGSGWNCSWPLAIIRGTEHGDYGGGSVEASNHRRLLELFPGLTQIIGSHGYKALAYDATLGPVPESEDLADVLEDLEGYCLVDEDDHSELERELESEAWDDHGCADFREALVAVLDALDSDHAHAIPDDEEAYNSGVAIDDYVCHEPDTWKVALLDLWRTGCDDMGINGGSGFVVETGNLVHFYTDAWKAHAGCDRRYPTNRRIHETLRALAKALRA